VLPSILDFICDLIFGSGRSAAFSHVTRVIQVVTPRRRPVQTQRNGRQTPPSPPRSASPPRSRSPHRAVSPPPVTAAAAACGDDDATAGTDAFTPAAEAPPRGRVTRPALWKFEHVPGARLCEGLFAHYTMPDGTVAHVSEMIDWLIDWLFFVFFGFIGLYIFSFDRNV
jgi:hypothetical protein